MKKTIDKSQKKQKSSLVINLTNIENLYGEQNLASTSLFVGGFINFGYWKNLKIEPKVSKHTRIVSSKNLYKKIFSILDINKTDAILEVGCGLGKGCIMLHKYYKPKYVIGIDASKAQIQRANKQNKIYLHNFRDSIKFAVSEAENFQLHTESLSKIFSVEALQHFTSLERFLQSCFTTLKSSGKLVITTFFFRIHPQKDFIISFPNFACGVDKIVILSEFLEKLRLNGFVNIKSKSIGKNVWIGFDKWISQTEYKDTWDKNWIQAYKDGIIDYYIVEATKP